MHAKIRNDKLEEGRNLSDIFRDSGDECKARMTAGHKNSTPKSPGCPGCRTPPPAEIGQLTAAHELAVTHARDEAEVRTQAFVTGQNIVKAAIEAEINKALDGCADTWRQDVLPWIDRLAALDETSRARFPAWTPEVCAAWEPPAEAPPAVRIGRIEVDVAG